MVIGLLTSDVVALPAPLQAKIAIRKQKGIKVISLESILYFNTVD
jgi:hypothetical protein